MRNGVFIMGIIEDTAVKAKDAFDVVAKKTGEVLSIQKLKYNIACINSQLSKDYETLGRLYFEQLTAEKCEKCEDADSAEETAQNAQSNEKNDAIEELKTAIIEKKEKIKQMEDMLDAQKKVLICPVCSAKNPAESAFCSKCGTKLS